MAKKKEDKVTNDDLQNMTQKTKLKFSSGIVNNFLANHCVGAVTYN
jgi:hypothetical protein